MIAGFRSQVRRSLVRRSAPRQMIGSVSASDLRAATGPGFQTGATERLLQQATRR